MTVAASNGDTGTVRATDAKFALTAAVAGFFVVTLDAVVVNVALPSIRGDLGGGIAGLQWVVDGYALMFAALLLSSGSLADRIGARRAFGAGMTLFVVASIACGAAPTVGFLIAARFAQGAAAAVIMPATLILISQAYPDKRARARAVTVWAIGASVASTSGPIVGGLLTLFDWRLIFFINVPVGLVACVMLRRVDASSMHGVPFDWFGQVSAVVAMVALTYGTIEAGVAGPGAPHVLGALALAVVAVVAFVVRQQRSPHPMVPLDLFGSRTFRVALATGFAFMVAYYGVPFLVSLYLQGVRGVSAFDTGIAFLPMMVIGLLLTPFSARVVECFGARLPIFAGLMSMAIGLGALALLPTTAPLWLIAGLMVLVGLGGPLTMPPITAVLLNHVPLDRTGIASGVFNTSRQLGGAIAVAVFGALLSDADHFMAGLRNSFVLGALLLLATALASLRLPRR